MEDDIFNLDDLKLAPGTLNQILNVNDNTPDPDKEKEEEKEVIINQEDDKQKETKTESEKEIKTPSSESQEDSSTFSVFATLLKEEGVISLDEEEIKGVKTVEDLKEVIKKQIENSKFENLSESQKRYLESVESGIPQAEYEKIEKELNQLEKINDEVIEKNTQARFELIAYDFINKGFSKEKAIEYANRSIKLGTDIDDAKDALNNLIKVKTEEFKKTVENKKEEHKVSLEELKSKIEKTDTVLKDIKLTPKQKQDIYNLVSTKVDADDAGQPINEFNKWKKEQGVEAEILLGALYHLTNKFQNLGKILDTTKSKSAQELEKKLRQNDTSELQQQGISFGNGSLKYDINI